MLYSVSKYKKNISKNICIYVTKNEENVNK